MVLTGCAISPKPVAPLGDSGWPPLGWDQPRFDPVTNWVREPVFPPLPVFGASPLQRATLAWLASPSPEVTGYRLYWSSPTTTNQLDVGAALTAAVSNLAVGVTYTFYATAYTADGVESERSNEVQHAPQAIPEPPQQLRIVVTPQQSGSLDGPWTPVKHWPGLVITNSVTNMVFYRYHIQQGLTLP